MKKKFLLFVFLFLIFSSNSFAILPFKQSKVISTGFSPNITAVRGINFKPDGTRMYITNRISDADEDARVTQYTLTTPFDISTASDPVSTNLVGDGGSIPQLRLPHAIEFKPDGTRFFVTTNKDPTSVYQFKLTTPWDTTTLEFELRLSVDLTGLDDEDQVRALAFKPDGTRMFIGGKKINVIREYILTTPFDLSDVSLGGISTVDLEDADNNMRNIQFNSDGSQLFIAGNQNNDMRMYSLSTPYDVTTLSSTFTTFDLGSRFSNMRGFIFAFNFTRLFVTDDNAAGSNTIFEYSVECAGIITCIDPTTDGDVKAIIEANVESAKRIIRHNTLPIFHRMEWLRRHKNKDNLNNLNSEIDFTDEKITKLVSALQSLRKEKDRSYDSEDWFEWSEGRISLGNRYAINGSSRDIHSYGFSIGADKIKNEDRDVMHGYVFQYGNDNIDIGHNGTKLDTDSYSFALYQTKLDDDNYFTDSIIGLSYLDIDHTRVINGNFLKGNREGRQIFGSINFGKRLHDENINLNPGIKFDLGLTKLKSFREKTISNNLTDVLLYRNQYVKSVLTTIGVLFDATDKKEEKILNHHGRIEYVGDLSPSSKAEFYFLNNQSTVYEYEAKNNSRHNYRIGYGFDITSITGWSIVANLERFGASGKGYSNEFYLSIGYVPIDEMKFALDFDETQNTKLEFTNKFNDYDIKISSNYNFTSDDPNKKANILISNSF